MHIEPGFVSAAKVMGANVALSGLLLYYTKGLILRPMDIVKALIASAFFSLFMQGFHASVGPSELHFIGAMSIYLTLGFTPTLFGFAIGLLLQGLIFDPADLVHLAVNSLSLIAPLIAVHRLAGKKLVDGSSKKLSWKEVVKLDAIYYAGVTSMVGFWLFIAEVETPFVAWLAFASSYLAIVAIEPIITVMAIRALKRHEGSLVVKKLFEIERLRLDSRP